MCFTSLCINTVEIDPAEMIHISPEMLEGKIEKKLKTTIEGRCNRHGLVLPGSLAIVSRSIGVSPNEQFNGMFVFRVKYQIRVCNPAHGSIVPARIVNKNRMGILANIVTSFDDEMEHFRWHPLTALLPYQIHNGVKKEVFDAMNVGDVIQVHIVGKRFNVPDKTISFIVKMV